MLTYHIIYCIYCYSFYLIAIAMYALPLEFPYSKNNVQGRKLLFEFPTGLRTEKVRVLEIESNTDVAKYLRVGAYGKNQISNPLSLPLFSVT
jgi:hypothetical protein